MTPKEAKNFLQSRTELIDKYYPQVEDYREALEIAIKALETASCIKEKCAYCPHCEHCDVDDDTLAIKTLEQTRWIPVSERLPEVMDGTNGECSDDVLICVADDEQITISTGFYGYYPNSSSEQGWWSMWAYGCDQLDSKYKVVAWMPLPQPYKAESEDKE